MFCQSLFTEVFDTKLSYLGDLKQGYLFPHVTGYNKCLIFNALLKRVIIIDIKLLKFEQIFS